MLGLFSVAQAFGLLLVGLEILSNPAWKAWFALGDRAHLQTAVFLPMFLLALPAGVLADTTDRRRLILSALAVEMMSDGLIKLFPGLGR